MKNVLPVIDPSLEKEKIIFFLKKTFQEQKINSAVIGLSGGIDSALSFYLLKEALPMDAIFAFYLPYYDSYSKNIDLILGKAHFPKKNFKTISTKDGLSDDAVNALLFDNEQNLFIGSGKGLNRLNVKEYNASGKIQIRFYAKEEGFAGIECSRNATLKDASGNSWFATKNGLTNYNSAFDKINEVAPLTHITDLKLFFEKTDWSKFNSKPQFPAKAISNTVVISPPSDRSWMAVINPRSISC